jgi:NDP-sugar pyrophosphorylase family protein
VINGSVENSVLSPGVVVDVGAVVRDSIILFDSVVRPGAVVDRAILDKEVAVGPGAIVGEGTDYDVVNRREPGRLNTGITVVGKRAVVPRGVRIGRNVLVGEGARAADFLSRVIRSGSTVERPRERGTKLGSRVRAADAAEMRETMAVDIDLGTPDAEAGGRSNSGGRLASGEPSD